MQAKQQEGFTHGIRTICDISKQQLIEDEEEDEE